MTQVILQRLGVSSTLSVFKQLDDCLHQAKRVTSMRPTQICQNFDQVWPVAREPTDTFMLKRGRNLGRLLYSCQVHLVRANTCPH